MGLQIRLLGAFQLTVKPEQVSDLQHGRLQELLAYLLLHRGVPQSRQSIAYLLWPESSEKQARTNLRVLWHRLRKSLPKADQYLQSDNKMLMWRLEAPVVSDLIAFEQSLKAVQGYDGERTETHLLQAIGHYQGDFLPDCYSDWVLVERERLRGEYAAALRKLAARREQARDYTSAIDYARQLLQHDPVQEATYRQLMRLYALDNNRGRALHVYHECAGRLERELGVEPGKETQALYWRLLQTEAEAVPKPQVERPRLVGRKKDWQLLLAAWQAMRTGRTSRPVVMIAGEAGVGKTHLAEAFAEWVQRQGFVAIVARCFPATSSIPFAATAQWLRPSSLTELPDVWAQEVARLRPGLLEERPHLKPPDAPVEPWQRQRFLEGLTRALLVQRQPLLLMLDDAHWCDEESLVWLDYLNQYGSELDIFVVATLRTGAASSDDVLKRWRAGKLQVQEIRLGHLNLQRTAELISQLTGRQVAEKEVEPLYQFTEGNPLFVVETIRAGLDGDQGALPETVRAVLQWRVDQLSPNSKQLLEAAAVIGRLFNFNILARTGDLEEVEVIRCLDECWRRQILREREDDTYEFSHGILRLAVYTSLSPMRQRWLHNKVAQAMEQVYAENVDQVSAELAQHFDAAGRVEEAKEFYQRAASRAQGLHALKDAIAYLQRALAMQVEVPHSSEKDTALYTQLGELLDLTGQHEDAREAWQAALEQLPPEEALARSRCYRSIASSWLRQQSIEPAKKALSQASQALESAISKGIDEWWHELLELELARVGLFYYENRLENLAVALEQLHGPMEQHGSPQQRADFLSSRILLGNRLRRYRPSPDLVAFARQALEIAQQLNDPRSLARKTFSLGFQLLWVGQPDESVSRFHEALEMAQTQGHLPLQVQCLTYLSVASRLQGNETAARRFTEEALAAASQESSPMYIGAAQANLSWLAFRRDDAEEASRLGEAALAHWKGIAYPLRWLALLPLMALATEKGELESASRYAAAMLDEQQQWLPERLQTRLRSAVDAHHHGGVDLKVRLWQAIDEAHRLSFL